MPRRDPLDRSSILAFTAFAIAATVWIGVMAAKPKPAGLLASMIVIRNDIVVTQPQMPLMELADLH